MEINDDSAFRITMKSLLGEGIPVWQEDEDFIKLYNQIQPYSLVSPHRCFFIYQFAKTANALTGHFAELGVYAGGSAKLISSVKSAEKKLFLFDTFEGLPEGRTEIDDYGAGKFSETSLESVQRLFQNDSSVTILSGLFPKTADFLKRERFAFVYLDADLYNSTLDALNFFYPRMVPGGIILFDDYDWRYCKGVKKSIEDFITKNGIREQIVITTKYQAMLIKS